LALCGHGYIKEGISREAASLAGRLRLDNLRWTCENNHITIEGKVGIAFTDDARPVSPIR
jgi:transketolase